MRYGEALPANFIIPGNAFWLRADLEKRNPFSAVFIPPGCAVMDCGAFIGTFACAALAAGAGRVTCYEASPKNAAVLRENIQLFGLGIDVIDAAIIAGGDASITLNLTGFSGSNTILPQKKATKSISVPARNFRDELARIRPKVVKLDVEGAEYGILESLRPGDLREVECLFVEFHPIENRDSRIDKIGRFLVSEGFAIRQPIRPRTFTAARREAIERHRKAKP